mmetsp:Transcript_30455/g.74097  ORF Transcript_30455/g.74097 Transcript_30455/m.74097 type:complete len:117 (-) Transcript_30455:1883-2233(-)
METSEEGRMQTMCTATDISCGCAAGRNKHQDTRGVVLKHGPSGRLLLPEPHEPYGGPTRRRKHQETHRIRRLHWPSPQRPSVNALARGFHFLSAFSAFSMRSGMIDGSASVEVSPS